MYLQQIREEGCLSYVIACPETRQAVIIDPANNPGVYIGVLQEKGLQPAYIIETHTHSDHYSVAGTLARYYQIPVIMHSHYTRQRELNAAFEGRALIKDYLEANSQVPVSMTVEDGAELELGHLRLYVMHTPGHTLDSITIFCNDRIFTGDALLIGACGRTDLPGGSIEQLYHTLTEKFSNLSVDLIVYPGHDYHGNINSSMGYESVNNPFLRAKHMQRLEILLASMHAGIPNDGEEVALQYSL